MHGAPCKICSMAVLICKLKEFSISYFLCYVNNKTVTCKATPEVFVVAIPRAILSEVVFVIILCSIHEMICDPTCFVERFIKIVSEYLFLLNIPSENFFRPRLGFIPFWKPLPNHHTEFLYSHSYLKNYHCPSYFWNIFLWCLYSRKKSTDVKCILYMQAVYSLL